MAYPIKTNNNKFLLKRIAELGATAVCDDADDLEKAQQAGFQDIIFSGMKRDNEHAILLAMRLDAYIVVEKLYELNRAIFFQQISKVKNKLLFKVNHSDDFPINYETEEVMSKFVTDAR
jgi:diaminopimelate decarboxylase